MKDRYAFQLGMKSDAEPEILADETVDGVEHIRVKKELIKIGDYYKASDGIRFKVTPEALQHWESTHKTFKSNGNKVELPTTHANAGNPKENNGWLDSVTQDGKSLWGIIDLYGPDAKRLAKVSDVSIYSPPEHTDGKGVKYHWPITHVALCTDPVIGGLQGFETIAASLTSTPAADDDKNFTPSISFSNKEGSMLIDELKKLFNVDATLEGTALDKAVLDGISGLKKTAEDLTAEITTLKTAAVKPEVPPTPAPEVPPAPKMLSMAKDNGKMKLNSLIASARITPAVAKKFEERYLSDKAVALSLSSKGTDDFDFVLEALKENDPVELKEQTGAQVLELGGNGGKKTNVIADDMAKRKERFNGGKK
jgi:hypothetical protein